MGVANVGMGVTNMSWGYNVGVANVGIIGGYGVASMGLSRGHDGMSHGVLVDIEGQCCYERLAATSQLSLW